MLEMQETTKVEHAVPAGLPPQMSAAAGVQPLVLGFHEAQFNPTSQGVLNGTYATHKSHERLKDVILSQTSIMQQTIRGQFSSMQDHMTYENLLDGLLFHGEAVLNSFQYLYYTHVEFMDESGDNPISSPMTQGRALLTDSRLLLMTAEVAQSSALNIFGDPKKTPGGYHIETSYADSTCYRPIPLKNFFSIELHTASGSKGEQNIHAKAPCCCGMFGCCFTACKVDKCTKTWHPDSFVASSYNERVILLGATLPPWGRRSIVKIFIHPNMSLTIAKDFVANLQCFAQNLH